MLKQLGYIDLVKAIQEVVIKNTGISCYDHVEKDAKSPFYFVEITRKRPTNTKTMYREVYTAWIHAIAEPSDSSVAIYNSIQKLEEALTEDIQLPKDFDLVMQTNNGVQKIKTDETNEKHAIIEFEFMICYGFKIKI